MQNSPKIKNNKPNGKRTLPKNNNVIRSRRRRANNNVLMPVPPTLALTGTQFTATSPLSLFRTSNGTTPGGIKVSGRELIGSATAIAALNGAFAILNINGATPFLLNPSTFPRLASYVSIYEWYKFHRVVVRFQPNQSTTAAGEVLLAVDYDVKDAAPTSSVALMRNISSTMSNIYSVNSLEILSSLSRLPKYATSQTSSPDTAQVNQAAVYCAVEGITAAIGTSLGYIVVQYEVEFFTPQ